MMRTSRLRRWVLRGALFSATVIAPVVIAQPVQADWQWGDIKPVAPTSQVTPADNGTATVDADDWQWG
jgi:hypothetical protein